MMLFARQLLLVLLPQVFCSAAATDAEDASPPIRKRTQSRHSSSDSTARLRGGSTRDTDNFDPFIGVPRELIADDLTESTGLSMSLSMSTTSPPTTTTPTTIPTMVQFDYEPCDDPKLVPIEVNIITDQYAEEDETSYRLISHPEDNSTEPVTYLERTEMDNSATYTDKICVPKGRYMFTVYDKLNGLCCGGGRGEYSIKSKGTEILYGGRFQTPSISYTILAGVEDMSDEDKQWLDGHNSRRRTFHMENGKTFKPLVWSESLAKAAADYAATITPNCQILQKKDPWGQNVAINSQSVISQNQILPDTVLGYMFDRKLNADYPSNNQLTQIAWRGSRYVGCASLIEQSNSGAYCHVSVCKYARPGNCSVNQDNWLEKTLADRSNCGKACPDDVCQ
mmetsp:Transcript_21431/g.32091  ORF Transcript_21431/g.32091 Transcript_21431/m.32091 type:complete len:395 (-) Transcript_21431:126-1310(-)